MKRLREIFSQIYFCLIRSQRAKLFLEDELPIRTFPLSWDQYEEQCLLFLHFGRQRLSQYLQQILTSDTLDDANYYGRYEKLMKKWSAKIVASRHPIEIFFENNSSNKTKKLEKYLVEWKNYLNYYVVNLKLEYYLIKVLLVAKMARYRPEPSYFVPPD